MTQTAAAAPTNLEELERAIPEARAALADAERALADADADVEQARERQGLMGLTARGGTAKAQSTRARKHEIALVAAGRVSGLEKQLAARLDQDSRDRARVVAENAQRFRAEAAELRRDTADTIRQVLGMFENTEAAFRSLNERAAGAMTARVRPPSDYQGVYARLIGSLEQYAQLYDEPRAPRPAPTTED